MWSNILDRVSYWALYLIIVLLPLFFFPVLNIPIEIGKGFLLVVGLAVSVVSYLGARFADGKLVIANSKLILSAFVITLVTFLSSIFSVSIKNTMFGTMFDNGTALFVFATFMLLLMSSIYFKDSKKAKQLIFGSMVSFSAVFLFQILRFISPKLLSFGMLDGKTDNLFGSWNSLGFLAGLSLLATVFIIEFFHINKQGKMIVTLISALSVFFIMAVNFSSVWLLVGIFALLMFVYKVSIFNKKGEENNQFKFPSFAFGVVMISLLFVMSGQFIGAFLPTSLNVSSIEVGPSFESTLSVGKASLAKDPVFGVGPNQFSQIWSLYKPQSINNTQFWDTPFSIGSGLIPTEAISTGILGILAWVLFLVLYFYFAVQVLFMQSKEGVKWEIPFFVFTSAFLLVSAILYSVSNAIFLLMFAYLGVALGMTYHHKEKGEITIGFINDPRKSFFAILALILLMVFSAGITFKYIEKFASVPYFRSALTANDITIAEKDIDQAVSLYANDLYYRTYAQIELIKLNSLVSKGDKITDEDKNQILQSYDRARINALSAVNFDPNNYINQRSLATVFSTVASLGVKDADIEAVKAFDSAISLNPLNPGLYLSKSQVYLTANKLKEAKDNAKKALDLKPNYVDALIFLSQIVKREGDNSLALQYAEQALSLLPNNSDLQNYVNSLRSNKSSASVENATDDTKDSKDTKDKKDSKNN